MCIRDSITMDTISHALWGKGLFGYQKYKWWPLLFGAIPDLASFGVYYLFNLIINPSSMKFGKPELSEIPSWVFNLYDISHSMIIAVTFILIARGNFKTPIQFYVINIFFIFLLFSIILKWSPWSNRLLLPFFIISAPIIGFGFFKMNSNKLYLFISSPVYRFIIILVPSLLYVIPVGAVS